MATSLLLTLKSAELWPQVSPLGLTLANKPALLWPQNGQAARPSQRTHWTSDLIVLEISEIGALTKSILTWVADPDFLG
jgi:hypothetical protein